MVRAETLPNKAKVVEGPYPKQLKGAKKLVEDVISNMKSLESPLKALPHSAMKSIMDREELIQSPLPMTTPKTRRVLGNRSRRSCWVFRKERQDPQGQYGIL